MVEVRPGLEIDLSGLLAHLLHGQVESWNSFGGILYGCRDGFAKGANKQTAIPRGRESGGDVIRQLTSEGNISGGRWNKEVGLKEVSKWVT